MKMFKLIFNSFSKPRKFFVLFSLLIGLTISFISFLNTYSQISYRMRCSDILYGDYTSSVVGYSEDYDSFLKELSESNKTEYIYPFYSIESRNGLDETEISIYCVDDNFWKHTEYELIEGKYPSSDSEVVCERAYLYHLGYTRDQMIGAEISLYNQNYKVCGIYTRNLLYVDNLPKHIVFTAYNGKSNSFIFKVKDSFFEDPLLKNGSYNVNMQTNFNNLIKLSDRSRSKVFHSIVFIVLLICTSFIFNHLIVLIMKKHIKTMAIYDLIGISRSKVWSVFFSKILISVLLGAVLGTLLYGISLCGIILIYNKICGLSINEIMEMISFRSVIKNALMFIGIILIIILVRSIIVIIGKKAANNEIGISNSAKVKKKSPRITSSLIAARHFKLSFFSNLMSILVIAIIIAAFSATKLYLKDSRETLQLYKEFDYMVNPISDFSNYFYGNVTFEDFIHIDDPFGMSDEEKDKAMDQAVNDFMDAYESYESSYKQVQKEELNELDSICNDKTYTLNIYNCFMSENIKTDAVSESLKQYLRDYTDAYYDIMAGKNTISLDVELIVLSDNELKNIFAGEENKIVSLDNYQCIAFSYYTSALDTTDQLLFKTGDKIELSSGTLNVSAVKERYINDMLPADNCIVLGVSLDTFISLTNNDIPSTVLFKVTDSDKDKFEKLLSAADFFEVTNLAESIQQEKIEKGQNILYYVGMVFLLIFSVLSCVFTIYIRCLIFEKEYATMNVVGIPSRFTRGIIIKELFYIILPVIVMSFIAILPVYIYISNLDSGYSVTRFPIASWSGSCCCVIAIGMICAALLIKKFDNYLILENKE